MADQLYDEFIKLLSKGPTTPTDAIRELKCGRDDFYNKIKKVKADGIEILSAEPPRSLHVITGWIPRLEPGNLTWNQLMQALVFVAVRAQAPSNPKRTSEAYAQRIYNMMLDFFHTYDPEQFDKADDDNND